MHLKEDAWEVNPVEGQPSVSTARPRLRRDADLDAGERLAMDVVVNAMHPRAAANVWTKHGHVWLHPEDRFPHPEVVLREDPKTWRPAHDPAGVSNWGMSDLKVPLALLLQTVGDHCSYVYDLGDY